MLVLLLLAGVVCGALALAPSGGLLVALAEHFGVHCVIFVYTLRGTGLQDDLKLLREEKFLGVPTVALPLELLTAARYNHSQSLLVLVGPTESLRGMLVQLSQTNLLSGSRWVLLLPNASMPLEVLFSDVNVPLDCKLLVVQPDREETNLFEVFRVTNSAALQTNNFGQWNKNLGLQQTPGLQHHRGDLKGILLRAAVGIDPPFTEVVMSSTPGINTVQASGFFCDVWLTLASRMNFRTEFLLPEDRAWGTLTPQGWNGMIAMLLRGEVDAAISEITITYTRANAVKFSMPVLLTSVGVYIRQSHGSILDWAAFLSPFSCGVWLSTGAMLLSTALYLTVLHNLGRRCSNVEAAEPNRYRFKDTLFLFIGIFCQQGQDTTPVTWSCRIVFWTSYLCAVVLLSAYSANLIAHLAVHKPHLPFTSLKGMLDDGSYKLGVQASSSLLDYFDEATDTFTMQVYRKLIATHTLPSEAGDGFRYVCSQERYAYMATFDLAVTSIPDLPCSIIQLPESTMRDRLALALSPQSPYQGIINQNLNDLQSTGIIKRLYHKEWPQLEPMPTPPLTDVGLVDVAPIFALLVAGLLAAILLLVCERLCFTLIAGKHQRETLDSPTSNIKSQETILIT